MASFAVVPNDASADTETQSDVPCVTAEPQQTNQKRRVALGLIAAAALMATGAAVTTTKSTSATQWAGAVSMAVTTNGMGCSDWETVKIGNLLNFNTLAECTAQCEANPYCAFANYQPGDCSGGDGSSAGSCYLFSGCTQEPNPCWDLVDVRSTPATCTKKGMGCSNWETAKLGNLLNFATEAQCTAQCAANTGCTYSNYQPGGCSSDEDAEKGACYLFSSCDEEKNTCWDLTPASGCSSTTSTTTPR